MAQLLGIAVVKYDGKELRSSDKASIDLGGVERKSITGNAVHGYVEEPKASKVECQIPLGQGDSLEPLRNAADVTVTFECDTGQVYVVPQAWLTQTLKITDGDGGGIPVEFEGLPAEEMLG